MSFQPTGPQWTSIGAETGYVVFCVAVSVVIRLVYCIVQRCRGPDYEEITSPYGRDKFTMMFFDSLLGSTPFIIFPLRFLVFVWFAVTFVLEAVLVYAPSGRDYGYYWSYFDSWAFGLFGLYYGVSSLYGFVFMIWSCCANKAGDARETVSCCSQVMVWFNGFVEFLFQSAICVNLVSFVFFYVVAFGCGLVTDTRETDVTYFNFSRKFGITLIPLLVEFLFVNVSFGMVANAFAASVIPVIYLILLLVLVGFQQWPSPYGGILDPASTLVGVPAIAIRLSLPLSTVVAYVLMLALWALKKLFAFLCCIDCIDAGKKM